MRDFTVTLVFAALCTIGEAQAPPDGHPSQPLYRVTIVSRTTKALNYGYLTAPTRIYFTGTPLLMGAKGDATIEPRRGTTLITAHFKDVPPPTRFGAQYLTYVVWAISPEGHAQNLGELVLNGSNKGTLKTSTPMQTFALIVTAEPYYSVPEPSDVVVMENVTGPDTVGKVEEVNATFELLPRKEFTYDPGSSSTAGGKPVSRGEYEAIVAEYEAQSAIQRAEAQGADRYAPEKLAHARQLLQEARQYPAAQHNEIVSMAREATQVAEDCRSIAVKRTEAEHAAAEQVQIAATRKQAEADRAAAEASERAQAQADADRAAAQVLPPAAAAPAPPPAPAATPAPPPAVQVNPNQFHAVDPAAAGNRRKLIETLSGPFNVTDTPRGIVVTLDSSMASNASLMYRLRPVADAIRAFQGVHVEVDAHSSGPESLRTEHDAGLVRQALVADAVNPDIVAARGFGNSRPRDTNATAEGRARNDRIEIVIAGDPIGSVPLWDHTYSLGARR
jgi:flagellar motor protein MotB